MPIVATVGVFGILRVGAAAARRPLTVISSVVSFSGEAWFTMVGLWSAAASPLAVGRAVTVLAVRHVAPGAAIRLRLARRSRSALRPWPGHR